jgi:phage tail protein X
VATGSSLADARTTFPVQTTLTIMEYPRRLVHAALSQVEVIMTSNRGFADITQQLRASIIVSYKPTINLGGGEIVKIKSVGAYHKLQNNYIKCIRKR